ncbi:hypothetical protein JAAARDRAFT_211076 [Jaapia argillacea MUCL 33604]|uniref:Uncharacterized protein n=1 Tax=Jaapia argillacea MUCL 33604 TaxID=933084 RepID=A0A067P9N4_9AGAM|nr:hypothetical protein JAAARDRAFT_211076 [Jaapia argillacea MUCL 33604]
MGTAFFSCQIDSMPLWQSSVPAHSPLSQCCVGYIDGTTNDERSISLLILLSLLQLSRILTHHSFILVARLSFTCAELSFARVPWRLCIPSDSGPKIGVVVVFIFLVAVGYLEGVEDSIAEASAEPETHLAIREVHGLKRHVHLPPAMTPLTMTPWMAFIVVGPCQRLIGTFSILSRINHDPLRDLLVSYVCGCWNKHYTCMRYSMNPVSATIRLLPTLHPTRDS